MCEQTPVQRLHYLRRLSLDLRGHLPSVAEYQYVAQEGAVSPQQIDEMLATEDFVERMRRYHRDLLWVNIDGQRLTGNYWRLNPLAEGRQRCGSAPTIEPLTIVDRMWAVPISEAP